jgi:Spy/CpxP family protein refolding chaperone
MRINKISIVAALALGGLLAWSTLATAQDAKEGTKEGTKEGKKGGRGGFSVERQMDRLTTELTLTDAQKPKVKAVLEDTAKKRQELFADNSVPREQRREKMQGLMQEQEKKMKEILTPEQQEKYQKMMEQRRQNQGGGKKREASKQE